MLAFSGAAARAAVPFQIRSPTLGLWAAGLRRRRWAADPTAQLAGDRRAASHRQAQRQAPGLTVRELQTWYAALHPLAQDLTAVVVVVRVGGEGAQAELLKADTRTYEGPAKKRCFRSDIEGPSQIAGVQGHVQRMDRALSLSEEATSPEASSSSRTVSGPPKGAGEVGLVVEHHPQRNSRWDIKGPETWAPDVHTAGDAADDGEGRGLVARSLRVDAVPLRVKLGLAPALAVTSNEDYAGRRSESYCAGASPPPTFFWTATTSLAVCPGRQRPGPWPHPRQRPPTPSPRPSAGRGSRLPPTEATWCYPSRTHRRI